MISRETTATIAARCRRDLSLLSDGARLPSDRELAERYDVGRGVMARVMAELEREGVVRRRRGAGTYWLGLGEALPTSTIPSWSGWARAAGGHPGFKVLAQDSRRVVATERDYLRLPANSLVWRIQRIFVLDDVPVGFATSVLPVRDLSALPSELDHYGSIFETMRRRYRIDVVRAWKRRRPVEAPAFVGEALGLSEPDPFRFEESLNCAPDGTPVEYARTFVRCGPLGHDALIHASRASTHPPAQEVTPR